MKNILILLTVLLLPLTADGQDKPSFSAREMADVRVATPGLFLPMELVEDIREQILRPVQKIRFVLLLME